MALTITSDCINCDICVAECPNDAITMGTVIYQINPETCTECEGYYDQPQCIPVCPVDSIIQLPANR